MQPLHIIYKNSFTQDKNKHKETDVLNPLHPLAEWQLAILLVNPFLLSPIK
jgi:hypothetical protein